MHKNNSALPYLRRCLVMLPAVPVCALGVVVFLQAGLGSDPLSSFELALSQTLGVRLGTASMLFEGAIFFLFLKLNRKLVSFGSAAFCFGIGPCLNLFQPLVAAWAAPLPGPLTQAVCVLLGSGLIILSLAYYIPLNLGYQCIDILSLHFSEKLRRSYGFGLRITYAILFALTLALQGPWGIGTLIAVFGYGWCVDRLMPLLRPHVLRLAGMELPEQKSFLTGTKGGQASHST